MVKKNESTKVVIVSLTDCNKTLQPKHIKELKEFKKSFTEQHRINLLVNKMNASMDNYNRKANNSSEKRFHCSMVNAIVERLGKDYIKADSEESYRKNVTGQKIIALLTKNEIKFTFRIARIEVEAEVKPPVAKKQAKKLLLAEEAA